jgi:hypothetical protein
MKNVFAHINVHIVYVESYVMCKILENYCIIFSWLVYKWVFETFENTFIFKKKLLYECKISYNRIVKRIF